MGFSGRIARFFLTSQLTPLIALIAALLGLFAILVTPREEEPQINVTMANVFVPFPGAGVAEVETHANGRRLVVIAAPGANPLPAVARLVHDSGWEVDALHVERGRLDAVFRDITREVA